MRSAVAFVSLIVLGSLAFTACGSDDDDYVASGGSGGAKAGKRGGAGKGSANEPSAGGAEEGGATSTGGTSGRAAGGKGGSSGRAAGGKGGKGGSSGKAGKGTGGTNATGGTSAGTGANATGGTAGGGRSGGGGTSGSGASSGDGSSGDGSGGGGEGGGPEAGAGGQGGGPEPHAALCSYHCTDSTQCGQGSICNDAGLCVSALARPASCNTDDECMPAGSFWGPPCTSDAGCSAGTQACVAAGGVGWCALLADSPCFSGTATTVTKFGSSDQVSVCAVPGVCQRHACATTCAVDDDCLFLGAGPTCNTTTHFCGGCATDFDCFAAGVSHCDVPTGTCQCASNADCSAIPGTDTCVNGTCGCSSASLCTAYPDATVACE